MPEGLALVRTESQRFVLFKLNLEQYELLLFTRKLELAWFAKSRQCLVIKVHHPILLVNLIVTLCRLDL